MDDKKLKPISYQKNSKSKGDNAFQQNMLLKALTKTDDLEELKKVAKFKSQTEVMRTLDKLSIRKSFHDALADNGLSMGVVVNRLKDLMHSSSDKTALGAVNALLKSLGLDKYDVSDDGGKSWEEILLAVYDKEREVKKEGSIDTEAEEYEVKVPEIPESVKKRKEEEDKIGKSLYE